MTVAGGSVTHSSWLLACVALVACGPTEPPTPDPTPPEPDGFHDPLSTPKEPTLSPESFTPSAQCAPCHPTHYEEWQTSAHAYAMVDPVFRALVAVRQDDYAGAQDQFCTQCHSAIGTRGGEITPGFRFEDLSPIVLEGIGCESCHKVAEVVRHNNSGHVLDPDGPIRGPFSDPMNTGSAHATETADFFERSEFCAGCHDVVEVRGLELERPYEEWAESPAEALGVTCQSCHMLSRTGEAAVGGGERTVHGHRFVGVDVPLADGFAGADAKKIIRDEVVELLGGAAAVTLVAPTEVTLGEQLDVLVSVQSLISGHNLPTGTTFIRELWLEVVATDDQGQVLYRTGDLDENGDLRSHFSDLDPYGDNDLLSFGATLIDGDGNPVLFPWRAEELISNAIPPLYARTYTLFVPTDAASTGSLHLSARLRFRTHPPFLLRALGLPELIDKVEIYDIAADTLDVAVLSP